MHRFCVLILCVCACNSDPVATPVDPVIEPAGIQVNVRNYGAKGDGITDDTAAFNAALKATGIGVRTLFVPAGTYILRPTGGSPRGGLELFTQADLTVKGEGSTKTTLRMAPAAYSGDTHLLLVEKSSRITISGLALDGNRLNASFSDEQNHCSEISRSKDVRFEAVLFRNCRGDGIRLIAPLTDADPWTERITVSGSRFEDNGRSGIAVQRGVRFLNILNNTFDRISDQSIDVEPTGSRPPTDILIEGNVIRHSSYTWAVAIGGINSTEVSHRLTFRNNRVENGAVTFGKADSVLIEGNTIIGDPRHSALRLARNITNLRVIDNDITGAGGEEGLVTVISYNGAYPSRVTIDGNRISATGGQTGIYFRDALLGVNVLRNQISGSGKATGISVSNIADLNRLRNSFALNDNTIRDFVIGVRFNTSNDAFKNVKVWRNSIDNGLVQAFAPTGTIGLLFEGTGPYEAFASIAPNTYGPGIARTVVVRN